MGLPFRDAEPGHGAEGRCHGGRVKVVGYIVAGLAVLMLLAATAHLLSAARFRSRAMALVAEVTAGPGTTEVRVPEAVRRFAERNGAGGTGLRAQRIVQQAEFRSGREGAWGPMPAVQHIGLGAPNFVWYARAPGPLVPRFTVIDAYVSGRGVLRANLLGSVPVANATGPVIDRSEAMRYLAELPWAPDAILGNPDILWSEREDGQVEAALDTPSGRAAILYTFDEAGDIVATLGLRPDRGADGAEILREWRGTFGEYGWVGGRRIPTRGEVGYVEDGSYWAYWRGRVTDLELLR
jgi:hypothetical protein